MGLGLKTEGARTASRVISSFCLQVVAGIKDFMDAFQAYSAYT